jgi:PPK2 family polyphosphate:nucleotide phosphotransferase
MPIAPVAPNTHVDLDALSTRPPDDLPGGEERDEGTEELLEALEAGQAALQAEGTRALLLVLQARDTAGKDGTIRGVFGAFSPQGVRVTSFKRPTEEELAHDFLWRVHKEVPPRGMVGVFNRSHYEDVLAVRVRNLAPEAVWRPRYQQINDFERLLSESGTTIVKLFLHISKEEQAERLRARLDAPDKNWKFQEGDIDDRALWDDYTAAYEEAISQCSTPWAPWYGVPGDKKKARNYLVAQIVADVLARMNPQYPRADKRVLELVGKIV